MSDAVEARNATLARLEHSRAEILRVLEAPRAQPSPEPEGGGDRGGFPRSRTLKTLMSGGGSGTIGAVGALVGGALLARPALAFRLLRMLPTDALASWLMAKAVSALRSKKSG